MSDTLHHVSVAALVVAIVLGVCAALARWLLDAGEDDIAPIALQHLNPLSSWCVGAVALAAVAAGLSGHAGPVLLAVLFVLAAAAVLLRVDPATAAAEAPAPPPPEPAAVPAPAEPSLWVNPADETRERVGLWSRG